MAVYAIGDVQGCYSQLQRLLDKIRFDSSSDTLWFCGDLVNRGMESLQTLQFVKSLGDRAITVLGNHDLHLLALYYRNQKLKESDTLYQVLSSPDCDELMEWLLSCPLVHFDADLDWLVVHAGIHPSWDLKQALDLSAELESVLKSPDRQQYFEQMYGDLPGIWSDDLNGFDRLRCITNVFTRMRFLASDLRIDMDVKVGPGQNSDRNLIPWFEHESCLEPAVRVAFGHWASLNVGAYGRNYATDSGCVWGRQLTALQVDTAEPRWYHTDGQK